MKLLELKAVVRCAQNKTSPLKKRINTATILFHDAINTPGINMAVNNQLTGKLKLVYLFTPQYYLLPSLVKGLTIHWAPPLNPSGPDLSRIRPVKR